MWLVKDKFSEDILLFDKKPISTEDGKWYVNKDADTLSRSSAVKLPNSICHTLKFEDGPIDTNQFQLPDNMDMTIISDILNITTDVNFAYKLCKKLEGRCYIKKLFDATYYVKIHKVEKPCPETNYILAETTVASYGKVGNTGTFDWEKRYIFECKNNSTTFLWRLSGGHSCITEITNDEYVKAVKDMFNEYLKNEIL